jgi:prepilin-type N-terminal cleavage/methylation domain-containing protein
MRKTEHLQQGFTLVEILIVIVTIAILATTTVAAYSGMQGRARDSQRVNDMDSIVKALEMYKTLTGSYPAPSGTNTISGWEVSSINPSQFLSSLKTAGVVSAIPVDPINNSTTNLKGFLYKYYRYNAGTNGCDSSRGAYYVLAAGSAETASGGQLSSSPGFQCSGRNWGIEGGWITGGYTN